MADLAIEERAGRVTFGVRLIPRAARSAIAGIREGALLVRVTAAPVDGAANKALLELMSGALKVPRSAIRIEAGATAPRKRLSAPSAALERLRALK
ncbi:MAG TPA: DUF167 domain-containing protein [Candidatus Limnocylindria bacterium]|nr:DUF167 domain-containing protein [Candidatus Limnocylindria bacterium]